MFRSIALLAAFFFAASAHAADIQLSPVNMLLPPSQKVESLRITNTGSAPIPVQLRGYSWDQADGQSIEIPTQEIRFQPAIATIQPGQTQVIRIIKAKAPAGLEESYRVVVSELPTDIQKADSENKAVFLLNYSLPLFYRDLTAAPSLRSEYKDGALVVTNGGTATAKISALKSGGKVIVPGLVGYVLPGSTMTFPIGTANGAFTATVNGAESAL